MELRTSLRALGLLLLIAVVFVSSESESNGPLGAIFQNMTGGSSPNSTQPPATSISPEYVCQHHNSSCEECVKHTRCYYCYSTSQCLYYPFASGFTSPLDCDMGEMRWAVCWFNFKALIISLSVMAGVLLISLTVCICCCCRKKKTKNRTKYAQEEAKREREREERRIRSEERRMERKLKNDEIRRKYGLMKEETPYERFDA